MSKLGTTQLLSMMKFKKGWKNGKVSYLATLEKEDAKVSSNPPKEIMEVLMDYENVMPPKL